MSFKGSQLHMVAILTELQELNWNFKNLQLPLTRGRKHHNSHIYN